MLPALQSLYMCVGRYVCVYNYSSKSGKLPLDFFLQEHAPIGKCKQKGRNTFMILQSQTCSLVQNGVLYSRFEFSPFFMHCTHNQARISVFDSQNFTCSQQAFFFLYLSTIIPQGKGWINRQSSQADKLSFQFCKAVK